MSLHVSHVQHCLPEHVGPKTSPSPYLTLPCLTSPHISLHHVTSHHATPITLITSPHHNLTNRNLADQETVLYVPSSVPAKLQTAHTAPHHYIHFLSPCLHCKIGVDLSAKSSHHVQFQWGLLVTPFKCHAQLYLHYLVPATVGLWRSGNRQHRAGHL